MDGDLDKDYCVVSIQIRVKYRLPRESVVCRLFSVLILTLVRQIDSSDLQILNSTTVLGPFHTTSSFSDTNLRLLRPVHLLRFDFYTFSDPQCVFHTSSFSCPFCLDGRVYSRNLSRFCSLSKMDLFYLVSRYP